MRRKLVIGNWKMNLTPTEASAMIERLVPAITQPKADVAICPSFVALLRAKKLLERSPIKLGAQDVHWSESGAFTGSVSPNMLKDAGVSLCIVGHSETRGRFGKLETPEFTVPYFAESDQTVNLKIKALLYCSIAPVLCVGETLAEREDGKTDEVIAKQLDGALEGIDAEELQDFVVAYEPVWAIGTGKVCDTPEAERVCATIRDYLRTACGNDVADRTRILYGGSVKAANAKELFAQPNIDGGLVGGASLNPQEFAQIAASV